LNELQSLNVKSSNYRVLIVDDEEPVRKLIETLLSQRGHQCITVSNGLEALDKISKNIFDAVITDIVMPKMDGITLTKELLTRDQRLPVMVMTGYAGEYSAETAIASGAQEFINKPFSIAEFIIRFHKMMREHEILYEIEAKTKDVISNLQGDSNEKIGQPEGNSIVGRKDLTSTKEEIRNMMSSENCKAPNFPESISQYLINGTHENQYRFKIWGVQMAEYRSELSESRLMALGSLAVGIIGIFDWLVENQLPFSMLYLVPIMLVTWFGGMRSGIKTSVASALVSLLGYLITNRFHFDLSASYWASTVKLGFFLIVVPMLWVLKSTLEHQQQFGRTDFLTGVPNRRSFIEAAKTEISRAQRYGHPLTVIYIDLNNFKMINDRFGHATGDKLLRWLAQAIREKIRETDLLARLGGDEFVILLPETDSEVAELVVQRLQGVSVPVTQEKGGAMLFSMGVVTFLESPASMEEMLSFADKIMYSAKQDGKTGICRKTFSKSERFTEMSKPVHRNRCNTAQENFQDFSMIGA